VPIYLLNHVVPAFPSSFRNVVNNPLDLFRLETVLKVFSLGQRRSRSRAKADVLRDATGRAGCEESRFFTRDWDRVFVVDVEWKDNNHSFGSGNDLEPGQLQGRIPCEWNNKYASEFELILSILSGSSRYVTGIRISH